jgi:integrase/recombinase XerD
VDGREHGPILRNTYGAPDDLHAAPRRLKALADKARIRIARMHPHMLRHTFVVTETLNAGGSRNSVRSFVEARVDDAESCF